LQHYSLRQPTPFVPTHPPALSPLPGPPRKGAYINAVFGVVGSLTFHALLLVVIVVAIGAYEAAALLAAETRRHQEMLAGPPAEEEIEVSFEETAEEPPAQPNPAPEAPATADAGPEEAEKVVAVAAPPEPMETIRFLDTDGMDAVAPNADLAATAKFISDKNTRAASEGPAAPGADPNLPSQAGEENAPLNMRNKTFVDGDIGNEERIKQGPGGETPQETPPKPEPAAPTPPPPAVAATETPPPPKALAVVADETPSDEPSEAVAMDKPPEPPTLTLPTLPKLAPQPYIPPPEQDKPRTGSAGVEQGNSAKTVQAFTRKNKMVGGVANRGEASVDAVDTPQGRYMARVSDAVQKTFQPACHRMRGRIGYGSVPVNFDINAKGEVTNLTLANLGKANVINQEVALDAVARAKFPPLPEDLQGYLIDGKLNVSFLFTFR
jgi:outer membrane biosynthesis protein TonB